MSELKSRPPAKKKLDLDAFIRGAEEKSPIKPAPKAKKETYPWEEPGVRSDVTKPFNLRLPEPYLLKLRYIAERVPESMQKFCLNVIEEAIDNKIEQLSK